MTPPKKRTLVSFDWAIRNILRDKANFDILEGFLTTLLGREITVLSLLESKDNQPHSLDSFYRLDLLVEDEEGMNSIVQIQHDLESQYLQRLLYGTSKLIVENLRLEKRLSHVRKVISIRILYLLLGDGKDDYIYHGKTEFRGMTSGRSLNSQTNGKSREAQEARGTKRQRWFKINLKMYKRV